MDLSYLSIMVYFTYIRCQYKPLQNSFEQSIAFSKSQMYILRKFIFNTIEINLPAFYPDIRINIVILIVY